MRAINNPQFGGLKVLTLADAPMPTPGKGEVLIKVIAAGLNRANLLRQGR